MTFQFCIICLSCIIIGAVVIDLLWTMFILRFFLNEQYTPFVSLPVGTNISRLILLVERHGGF